MSIIHCIDIGLALTAALINSAFILLVLTRTARASVYVTFLLNCVAAVIWTLFDFMVLVTDHRFPWYYFSLIGTGFIPALLLHLISALVGLKNIRGWITASYILCAPLALSSPLALWNSGIKDFVDGNGWDAPFLALLFSSYLAGTIMLTRAIKKAKSKKESSRFRYVLVAMCIGCLFGTICTLWDSDPLISPLGHLGAVIYSSILAISVFKHRAAYDLVTDMRAKLDMLNELAAGIAHELRNPLSSIKGAASLLNDRSGNLTVEKSREYLSIISEEVERLDGILTNYRSLMRPIKIDREPISVNNVIEKTVALMRMGEDALGIELSLSSGIPLCTSDPQTLRQVFINLIQNAREACRPEGRLYIATQYLSPSIRITFTDSGGGIPREILPRIFEPFVSTKANGMGLGLAICRRLVDLNGGAIEAANEGGGARITIHLPAGADGSPGIEG
jgi:signal transduction histidine kinase